MGGVARGGLADAVRGLFGAGTAVGATDGELLERFAGRRDEGAFAALVGRHGPMVLRACRSALGDDHDAHDAFQATFLVLARKGASLRSGDALGPWLHRVALRASGRARRAASRRRAAERRAASRSAPGPVAPPDPDRREVAAVVQEEVDRLPDPYRAAVVLCDLEGLTCEQAAGRLGCPAGTVASRLARGRDRLRERLRRRGLDPRAATLAPAGALPSGLAESTTTAAVRFLTSSAVPSGAAVSLALGVLRAMSWKSAWNAAAVALALAASTSGVVALAARAGATVQEPEPPVEAETKAPATAPPPIDVPTVAARPGPIRVVLASLGRIAPLGRVALRSTVGSGGVASVLPSGTRVAKGDVVARIDPTELKRALERQEAAARDAEREADASRAGLELAELALADYEQGASLVERGEALGAIQQAEAELTAALARQERTKRALERSARLAEERGKSATAADLVAELDLEDRAAAADLAVGKARHALEQAQTRRDVLERLARPLHLKRLQVELTKARAGAATGKQAHDRAVGAADDLRRQIEACTIRSPIDGIVAEAPAQMARDDGTPVRSPIGPGRPVAFVQALDGRLVFEGEVSEEQAHLIRAGQQAGVMVRGGMIKRPVPGVVDQVVLHADPASAGGLGPRIAVVRVALSEPLPSGWLQGEGPAATATLEVATPETALSAPRKALVWYDGAYHVGVPGADGAVAWREVEPGLADAETVEIRSGLAAGEAVVADPAPHLSADQLRRISIAPPPANSRLAPPPSMGRGFQ